MSGKDLRFCRRSFLAGGSAVGMVALGSSLLAQAVEHRDAPEREPERTEAEVHFDLRAVPFSHAGSFLTSELTPESEGGRARITTNRRSAATYRFQTGSWSHELLDVDLQQDGKSLHYTVDASATRLRLLGNDCEGRISFLDPDRMRMEADGAEIALRFPRGFAWRLIKGSESLTGFDNASGYTLVCTAIAPATLTLANASVSGGASSGETVLLRGKGACAVEIHFSVEREETATVRKEAAIRPPGFAEWIRFCPVDPNTTTHNATRVAWYLFWASQVSPSGGYTRRTILSSRRSLSMIWSWDNLFNALTVVQADAALAWDQLLVQLDHQLPNGVLPDVLSDVGPVYGFRKPPLWAWTIVKLLRHTPAEMAREMLGAVYPKIVAYHRWWFRERDLLGDGAPVYLSGNDSGWDNATLFTEPWPVQSPDLLALLCLDAEALSQIAAQIGLHSEEAAWHEESERLLHRLHERFMRQDRLIYRVLRPDGVVERTSTSLLTRLPILLGERLQPSLRASLLRDLRDPQQFAAASGPASESLSSPRYNPDGYWSGPVWGPSTLLVCEGLWRCGERELARDFAQRYRTTCARKSDFRENYDARTGEGRYDTGMTWSASDFLLLGELLRREA